MSDLSPRPAAHQSVNDDISRVLDFTQQSDPFAPLTAFYAANRRIILPLVSGVAAVFLLTFPLYASSYQLTQIAGLSLVLGIIALSLVFLAANCGLVSLAQMSIAGLAAYTIGIMTVSHSYPLWQAVPVALLVSTGAAFLFGVISVRTHGIYFLMITLALAMIVYNITLENYTVFNGHGGIGGEQAPAVGSFSFDPVKHPTSFYFLALIVAFLLYVGLRYITRAPFGLALQGLRDNPRRMRALGYWVEGHRVAAFTLSGFVAGVGGILYVWYYATINPTFIDLTHAINILIIAVIGGLIYLEGAFVGALAFTLVTNFASSYTDRYNSVIGLTFLLIVMFSPNGLIGLPQVIVRLVRIVLRLLTAPAPGLTGTGERLALQHNAAPAAQAQLDEVDSLSSTTAEEVDVRGIRH
jgi:branched-chain amino acid transport system permease protein